MNYEVEFAEPVYEQLDGIRNYLECKTTSPEFADRRIEQILAYCEENIAALPHQGTKRDDIRPGLRITNFEGSTVIAFRVNDARALVSIIGIFYGGQNYEPTLRK